MSVVELEDETLIATCLERIQRDLAMITDREIRSADVEVARQTERPAGEGVVHISFRIGVQAGAQVGHGCLLVPLPDALALAGYMMMAPDEEVRESRDAEALDEITKDTLMEVSSFIAGAANGALRGLGLTEVRAGSEGCQGVRPGVRPALEVEEGEALIVARSKLSLHDFAPFEAILVWPTFED